MRSRWRTGALAFAVWLLLAWPADAEASGAGAITAAAGLAVAALAMATRRGDAPAEAGAAPPADPSAGWSRWLDPRRMLWAGAFVAVFLWQVVLANLDVAYRILHPNLPIQPGIVKFRTALRSQAGRTLLANAITLTPGTLTVELTDDGWLFVHWLTVRGTDPEQTGARISGRLERILGRVFE